MVGTVRLSCDGVTDCNALHRTLQTSALPSTSAVDLVFVSSFKVDFNSLRYPCLYMCGKQNKDCSKFGNMHPSEYYATGIEAMILRRAVLRSTKKLFSLLMSRKKSLQCK